MRKPRIVASKRCEFPAGFGKVEMKIVLKKLNVMKKLALNKKIIANLDSPQKIVGGVQESQNGNFHFYCDPTQIMTVNEARTCADECLVNVENNKPAVS